MSSRSGELKGTSSANRTEPELPLQAAVRNVIGRLRFAITLVRLARTAPIEAKALEHLLEAESVYIGPQLSRRPGQVGWCDSTRQFQQLRLYYEGLARPAYALAALRLQWQGQAERPSTADVLALVGARTSGVQSKDVTAISRILGRCFRACNRSFFVKIRKAPGIPLTQEERVLASRAGEEDYLDYLVAKLNGNRDDFKPLRLSRLMQ